MAGIYLRSKTWWVKYSVGGRKVQKSLKTNNKRAALAKLKEIEYKQVQGALRLPSRNSVDEILRDFSEHLLAKRKKKSAETDIGRLKRFFGDVHNVFKILQGLSCIHPSGPSNGTCILNHRAFLDKDLLFLLTRLCQKC